MVVHSIANNSYVTLASGASFEGGIEVTTQGVSICVSTFCSSEVKVIIKQYRQNAASTIMHSNEENVVADTKGLVQTPVKAGFFSIKVENLGSNMTFTNITTVLQETHYLNLDIRSLTGARDSVTIAGGIIDISGVQDVNIVSPNPLPTYDLSANNTLTSIDSKVGLQGQNTDFAFFPDATNLTPAIYADGEQPIATNQAGWVYSNSGNPPNKINWYVFQDVTLPQYLVSEMDSIYFVISQITPATTLPFVAFYTMPNGINDVVPNFAKSKLVFAPSGSVPTAQGEYLFYVKSDPTHIRPEITNRYELTFVVAQSSKTLAQASGERLSLATLSTNSTDPAGSNYFLFQQYGIVWEKTSVALPVNNGLLDCNIVSQPAVVLTTGTADIGYVRLTAENLFSNPSTFANLQMVGANLQVEDQGASVFLSSIDGYTNSINSSTTSIASYNQSMESRLVNMDTKMITLSNTASTKTLTQTGANWTTDYTTLQSLTLSNVGGLVFSYVKLYNKATAPDQNDTPIMTIPLNHETVQQVVCNTLLFDLGIGVRATNAFAANDNTAPSGTVYATAFYKLG